MPAMSLPKPTLLIVGAGSIGERHLRCFQSTGRADVALCETDGNLRTTIADRYRVGAFADFHAALDTGNFDGIVICTPAHIHIPMATAALRAGAAVLVEKPLGTNIEGTDALLRLRDERNVPVAVAYVLRFTPATQQARALLRTGELGRPLHAVTVSGQHFPTFRPAYRDIYYARHETGGGAIQDALTHSAHTMEWLLGPAEAVFCDAAHQALEGVEVEDTVNVLARNAGVLVTYALNQFQAPNEKTLWLHCEMGSIKIEFHRNRWGVLRHGEAAWKWHEAPVEDRDTLFRAQADAFLDALEGKNTHLCSLEEGIQTLKFNLAALDSARSGKRVTL